jgi:DNA-binding SARP family transcriptional activator
MSQLRVSLFGKIGVRCDEQILGGFEAHKVQELFCYLLIYRNHSHHREALVDLLWREMPLTQSKRYLSKTLWKLQTALDSRDPSVSDCILQIEPEWIQLHSGEALWLDVAAFEQAFVVVQGTPGQYLDAQKAQALQECVQLYQGDLLEGWYQDWCIFERERLQQILLSMLDKLMHYCEACQEYEKGLSYGLRILRYDRAREHTHRQLMRLRYLAGDRTGALRQYRQCVAALDEELGVQPARETEILYKQLQRDAFDDSPLEGTRSSTSPGRDASPLHEAIDRIKQVQVVANELQAQVQLELEAAEKALRKYIY